MKDKKTPDTNREKIRFSVPVNKRLFKYVFLITLVIAVAYTTVTQPQKIGDILNGAVDLFSPFIIGFCTAYIVNLLLRPLERLWLWIWHKCKRQKLIKIIKRPLCLVLSFLIVLSAIFAIVFMIVPSISDTVLSFSDKIPQYAKTVEIWYGNLSQFLEQYNFELPELPKLVVGSSDTKGETLISSLIDKYGNKLLGTTVNVTTSIVSVVVDLVLGIVFAIYLLAQKEKLGNQIKRACLALFGKKRADRLIELAALTDNIFAKFVTGQLTEAIIIGILCFIGMKIFNMPYAGVISVLVGFTALIPMVGSFIGTGIGAVLILFENPIKAVWFVLFIIILQQIEGNLIYPKVVGKSVGLPGIWVLATVTVGGALFGIPGMLFGVPLCTVIYVVFKEYVNNKIKNPQSEEDDETEMIEEIKE